MKALASVLIIVFLLIACSHDRDMDKYNSLVKKELSGKRRVDSIFFGIHLGMARKNFFMHCWDLNKKGMFREGSGNMYVLYKLKKELKHPASMNFYPDFRDSVIYRMRVNIHYDGWVPWNKDLNGDSLLPDVLTMYRKWYDQGNPFMQINDEKLGTVYVKVDGNRRITIQKYDDMMVKVVYTDLLVEKQIKK